VHPLGTEKLQYAPPEFTYQSERERMKQVWEQLPMLTTLFSSPVHCSTSEEKKRVQEFWTAADYVTGAIKDLGKG
jgi:hypothetical protein